MHITRLTQDGDAWQLQAVERKTFTHDAVVIACGAGIQQLLPNWMPHLQIQKGQVAHLAASAWQGQLPTMPWMFDGYVMPAVAERICIGATFEKDAPHGITADGISHNLNPLANALPAHQYHPHQIIGGHSAYRMMTRDHLPLVGSLPNLDCYQQGVQPCVQRPDTCPDMARCLHPHLYLSIGHGSRGLSSSFLAAQVIAAQITGQTAPIGLRLSQAVHPARVLFRELTA
jgi:tRNA 5-methylaminomethyl-2-thiouridine biosynthesis bifunctional protein